MQAVFTWIINLCFLFNCIQAKWDRLLNSLKAVKIFMRTEPAISPVFEELEARIRGIIADNHKIQQYNYDPEMIGDLYYGVTRKLIDSPDERITWLCNLASFHQEVQTNLKRVLTCFFPLINSFLHRNTEWSLRGECTSKNCMCSTHSELPERAWSLGDENGSSFSPYCTKY